MFGKIISKFPSTWGSSERYSSVLVSGRPREWRGQGEAGLLSLGWSLALYDSGWAAPVAFASSFVRLVRVPGGRSPGHPLLPGPLPAPCSGVGVVGV